MSEPDPVSQNTPRRGRRPRSADGAAQPFPVRLTPRERLDLERRAEAAGVSPSELIRRLLADDVTAAAAVSAPAPEAPAYVDARPRPGVEPDIRSRWMPRHVWTLHIVPGRPNGPPLCVRRRVLRDEAGVVIETPGGRAWADEGSLEHDGHDRTVGYLRDDDEATTVGGQDLSLDVFDHCPTEDERAAWLARRKVEQAYTAKRPRYVWTSYPGEVEGGPDRAISRTPIFATDRRYCYRINGDFPGTFDLRDLAVDGVAVADAEPWDAREPYKVLRIWPRKPTADELAASGRDRARRWAAIRARQAEEQAREEQRRRATEEAARRAADAFWESARGRAWASGASPRPEPPGAAAVRALGLDPATATEADVQAAFRERAKGGHADHGGKADMGELVRLRDAARAYVTGRR